MGRVERASKAGPGGLRRRALAVPALAALALAAGACRSEPERPRDLPSLRETLLRDAKQNFKHALRITQRHSPDPFNQAREQLVFTMIELGEFPEAEATGREFLQQEAAYIEVARAKLAGIEVDWKKALAGDPSIAGSPREKVYLDGLADWKGRIAGSEQRILNLSLVLGEASLQTGRVRESIPLFKAMLDIKPDHNTALRRIGQAFGLLGEHGLAASYLEKAFLGIEIRVRDLRERMAEEGLPPSKEEPGTGGESRKGKIPDPGESEGPGERDGKEGGGESAPKGGEEEKPAEDPVLPPTPALPPPAPGAVAAQVQRLERAMVELAAAAGTLYFLAGEPPKSEEWFGRAFALDPTSPYVELKLGLSLLVEGRPAAAAANLARFRKTLPASAAPFLGVLLDRIGVKYKIAKG